MAVGRDDYRGYSNPGGPQLDQFKPAGYGDDLRGKGKAIHIGGYIRKRATAETARGANPKHGYLIKMAQKNPHRTHGYIRKLAESGAGKAYRKSVTGN